MVRTKILHDLLQKVLLLDNYSAKKRKKRKKKRLAHKSCYGCISFIPFFCTLFDNFISKVFSHDIY